MCLAAYTDKGITKTTCDRTASTDLTCLCANPGFINKPLDNNGKWNDQLSNDQFTFKQNKDDTITMEIGGKNVADQSGYVFGDGTNNYMTLGELYTISGDCISKDDSNKATMIKAVNGNVYLREDSDSLLLHENLTSNTDHTTYSCPSPNNFNAEYFSKWKNYKSKDNYYYFRVKYSIRFNNGNGYIKYYWKQNWWPFDKKYKIVKDTYCGGSDNYTPPDKTFGNFKFGTGSSDSYCLHIPKSDGLLEEQEYGVCKRLCDKYSECKAINYETASDYSACCIRTSSSGASKGSHTGPDCLIKQSDSKIIFGCLVDGSGMVYSWNSSKSTFEDVNGKDIYFPTSNDDIFTGLYNVNNNSILSGNNSDSYNLMLKTFQGSNIPIKYNNSIIPKSYLNEWWCINSPWKLSDIPEYNFFNNYKNKKSSLGKLLQTLSSELKNVDGKITDIKKKITTDEAKETSLVTTYNNKSEYLKSLSEDYNTCSANLSKKQTAYSTMVQDFITQEQQKYGKIIQEQKLFNKIQDKYETVKHELTTLKNKDKAEQEKYQKEKLLEEEKTRELKADIAIEKDKENQLDSCVSKNAETWDKYIICRNNLLGNKEIQNSKQKKFDSMNKYLQPVKKFENYKIKFTNKTIEGFENFNQDNQDVTKPPLKDIIDGHNQISKGKQHNFEDYVKHKNTTCNLLIDNDLMNNEFFKTTLNCSEKFYKEIPFGLTGIPPEILKTPGLYTTLLKNGKHKYIKNQNGYDVTYVLTSQSQKYPHNYPLYGINIITKSKDGSMIDGTYDLIQNHDSTRLSHIPKTKTDNQISKGDGDSTILQSIDLSSDSFKYIGDTKTKLNIKKIIDKVCTKDSDQLRSICGTRSINKKLNNMFINNKNYNNNTFIARDKNLLVHNNQLFEYTQSDPKKINKNLRNVFDKNIFIVEKDTVPELSSISGVYTQGSNSQINCDKYPTGAFYSNGKNNFRCFGSDQDKTGNYWIREDQVDSTMGAMKGNKPDRTFNSLELGRNKSFSNPTSLRQGLPFINDTSSLIKTPFKKSDANIILSNQNKYYGSDIEKKLNYSDNSKPEQSHSYPINLDYVDRDGNFIINLQNQNVFGKQIDEELKTYVTTKENSEFEYKLRTPESVVQLNELGTTNTLYNKKINLSSKLNSTINSISQDIKSKDRKINVNNYISEKKDVHLFLLKSLITYCFIMIGIQFIKKFFVSNNSKYSNIVKIVIILISLVYIKIVWDIVKNMKRSSRQRIDLLKWQIRNYKNPNNSLNSSDDSDDKSNKIDYNSVEDIVKDDIGGNITSEDVKEICRDLYKDEEEIQKAEAEIKELEYEIKDYKADIKELNKQSSQDNDTIRDLKKKRCILQQKAGDFRICGGIDDLL